jgi:hypothetical protein
MEDSEKRPHIINNMDILPKRIVPLFALKIKNAKKMKKRTN